MGSHRAGVTTAVLVVQVQATGELEMVAAPMRHPEEKGTPAVSYGTVASPAKAALATQRSGRTDYLFKWVILVQIFMYMEAGAVPSLLEEFTRTFVLSPQEQGLLGAVVYIAISAASPWCSTLFRRFSPRKVLGWSLGVNNFCLLLFALVPAARWYSKASLIFLRGLIGFTQAFHCVYSPLWVHEYAPKAKKGSWMSYLQGAVPIGITLGYLAGSVTVWSASHSLLPGSLWPSWVMGHHSTDGSASQQLQAMANSVMSASEVDAASGASVCHGLYCWRWPFLFQFLIVLPFCVLIFLVPAEHIKMRFRKRQSMVLVDALEDPEASWAQENDAEADGDDDAVLDDEKSQLMEPVDANESVAVQQRRRNRVWQNLRLLLGQKVYVCVVLGLSALFFVVSGVQFWTTLYLSTNTTDSLYEIHMAYLLVSGTGPILGVFFGGWLIDRFGGYAGPAHQARALQICVVLGVFACGASLPVSYFTNTLYIALCLWTMLFCGGSILPACSGIVISSTPRALRPLASSVAYTSYNLLGYAASSYIPGLIMSFVIDRRGDLDPEDTRYCDTACTYRLGFRIVLWWSIWSFFCMSCAAIFATKEAAADRQKQHQCAEEAANV